jgi:hypothetical protein
MTGPSIMRCQLAAMTDQTKLAREEFLASHRPLIVVHSVRLLQIDDARARDKNVPVVEFALVNAGTAGCDITGSRVLLAYSRIEFRPRIPDIERYRGVNKCAIHTGHFAVGATNNSVTVEAHPENSEHYKNAHFIQGFGATTRASEEPDWPLYFSGWVAYREASGNTRTTYFSRVYDRHSDRFERTGDPDENATY